MRLALADVKKAITRRAGDVYVAPRLLRPREHTRALAALIALHEEHAGRTRAAFPSDRPAELIGDYRLARCLMTSLGEWYAWESPVWPGPASPAEAEALAAAGIASPVDLRLALYDAANASGRGYLPSAERPAALDAFAASVGTSSRSHLSAPGEGEADRVRGTLRARRFAEDAEEEKRRLSLPGARGETGLAATTGSEGEPEAGGAADGESGGRSVGRAR
ncbi:MAG TPA: hypothetical protein VJQ45_10690, partial [Ktedonobacterales bacterium]|nr:hypothetical protein [Ktedonobacterales bacterium]